MFQHQIESMPQRIALRLSARTANQVIVLILALFVALTDAHAEGVTIESDDPAQSIKLEVNNATIRDVLQALHDKYGVALTGDGEAGTDGLMTLTLEGSLPAILERLLRNQNYMIVRSTKNVTGVEEILIAVPSVPKGKTPASPPEEPTPMP